MVWLVSWIASALELCGMWLVGNKNKWGFVIFMVGAVMWTAIGIFSWPVTGILLVVVPAFFINLRNFLRWKKQEKEK